MPKEKTDKNPILAAIDFSPHSEAVLLWAADAAQRYDVPLIVLHVVHDLAATPGYYNTKKGLLRRLEESAKDMMETCLRRFDKKHPDAQLSRVAETMQVIGLPVNRILEVAERTGASQIIIGSQGRTGLPHFILGSKAERVVQLSPIPVTIVKSKKSRKGLA